DRTVLRELDMVHSFGCHDISRTNCAESTIGGVVGWFRSATHRSTSALRSIQGALTQACVAGNCFNRKTVVGVTPRAAAPSLTDISSRACRSPSRDTAITWGLGSEQICFAVQLCSCAVRR